MQKHLFASFFFVLAICMMPFHSEAYTTSSQVALSADGKTGVFLIAFSFGHQDHEVIIPVRAFNGSNSTTSALTFSLLNSTQNIVAGSPYGIVLGNTPLRDGMYHVPKGKNGKFTLVVFYTKATAEPNGAFHLAVNGLPFTFDGTQQLSLNPSELQYYTTPSLSLQ